jgi:hypothetical protein
MNMPVSVTVSNITGSTPFEVYLATSGSSSYFYIDYIETSDLPYVFTVPQPLQDSPGFCLKVIDNIGCEINNCFFIT